MLNAFIPGTEVPILRYPKSSETVVLFYGWIDEVYIDSEGKETSRTTLHVGDGMQIHLGRFHTIQVHKPSIILEVKDGAYEPAKTENCFFDVQAGAQVDEVTLQFDTATCSNKKRR